MKLMQCMIAWQPAHGEPDRGRQVKVGPWPDRTKWSRGWSAIGACDRDWREAEPMAQAALLFIAFNTLVVRDNMDPQAVHEALLAIDEYRERISPDIPGADRD